MMRPRSDGNSQGVVALTHPGHPVDWNSPFSPNATANTVGDELEPNHAVMAAQATIPAPIILRGPTTRAVEIVPGEARGD